MKITSLLSVASIALACGFTAHAQVTGILESLPAWATAVQTTGPYNWSVPPAAISIGGHTLTEQTPNQPSFTLGNGWVGEVFYNGGFADWPTAIGFVSGAQSGFLWTPATDASKPFGYRLTSISGAAIPFALTFMNAGITTLQSNDSKVALYTYAPSATELYFYAAYNDEYPFDHDTNDKQVFGRFAVIPELPVSGLLMGAAMFGFVIIYRKYHVPRRLV